MLYVEAHGARIPALGFGTFRLERRDAERMVGLALEIGYRHIDTAQMYGNEREIGRAIAAAAVPREAIWLTTKIWPDHFRDGVLQRAAEQSVQRLGTEPDLLLLHWPNPEVPLAETVRALNQVRRQGFARHIGVSNFTRALLEDAWSSTEEPLVVDQVEYQPYLDQTVVLDTVRRHGMALTAYAPLAHGQVFRDPILQRIAAGFGKNPGQVTLRWLLQQDRVTAIPKSGREEHARANFDIFDFELSVDEMRTIGGLARPGGRVVNAGALAPDWD
jgi:2,5-diketo-D-gluconate reductase B